MSSDENGSDLGFDDFDAGNDESVSSETSTPDLASENGTVWDEAIKNSCSERDKIVSSPSQTSGMLDVDTDEVREHKVSALAQDISNESSGIDQNIIDDLEVDIQIVAGKTKMRLGDLLKLNQGSAIETTSLKDAPFLLVCNGAMIGRGDLCFINDQRGIRLTELVSDKERLAAKKHI